MSLADQPRDPAAAAPAARSASRRSAPLDQSGLMHLMGYAATRASVTLKQHFQRHLGPLQLKAVELPRLDETLTALATAAAGR